MIDLIAIANHDDDNCRICATPVAKNGIETAEFGLCHASCVESELSFCAFLEQTPNGDH